jgi:hypothetical protein
MSEDDIILQFDRYKGKHLSDVPLAYLYWLSTMDEIKGSKSAPQSARGYLANMPHIPTNSEPVKIYGNFCLLCNCIIWGEGYLIVARMTDRSKLVHAHIGCANILMDIQKETTR